MSHPLENETPTKCRGCGKPIVFVQNERTGRLSPVDPDPDPAGNVVVLASRAPNGARLSRVLRKGEQHDGARYTSHFQTCSQAAQFKR